MRTTWNRNWNRSVQPRKQRKYRANAPLHVKQKFMNVNLSKDLRKKYAKRGTQIRKGDTVRVMRGAFKKKRAKVSQVSLVYGCVYLDGVQRSKKDGTKVNVPFNSSNLQIIELYLEDKRRVKKLGEKVKSGKSEKLEAKPEPEAGAEAKPVKKQEKNKKSKT